MKTYISTPLIVLLFLVATTTLARTGYKIGDTAPEFELKTLAGNKVSLTSLRQQGHVLLVFWAAECVYCYSHVKTFNALHEKYHGKGLTIAAINVAGEYDIEIADYVKDNRLQYLVLSDRLNNIDTAETYHVVGTPTLVLISPEGKVIYYGYQIPDITNWIK